MNKQDLLLYTNICLAVAALAVGITGTYRFLLVQGATLPWANWIRTVHDWAGILFVLFAVLHVLQNIPWIVANVKRKLGKR